MLTFNFDSSVFPTPEAEMMIFLAVAAKTEYPSKEGFCKAAVDKHFQDNEEWSKTLKDNLVFKPVPPEDEQGKLLAYLYFMSPKVVVEHGDIKDLCEIYPSEWNDVYYFFESEGMYFYYNWSTTA